MQRFSQAFIQKFSATSGVRLSLGFSKWIVLLHGAKTLAFDEFAMIAAMLSLAEILRVASDCGTESILYARARRHTSSMPRFVKACFHLRTITSLLLCAFATAFHSSMAKSSPVVILLFLVPIMNLQSSALILLQRNFSRTKLAWLVIIAAVSAGTTSVLLAFGSEKTSFAHASLIVFPESLVMLAAVFLVRKDIPQLFEKWAILLKGVRVASGMLWRSAVGAIATGAYSRLDVWVVMPLLGAAQQADFSTGLRLTEPAGLLLALATTSFLSELGVRNLKDLTDKTRIIIESIKIRSIGIFFGVQLLLASIAFTAATRLLNLGDDVGHISFLFAFLLPIRAISSIISSMLFRLGRIDRIMIATQLNLVVTLVLSVTLGAHYGVIFICIATIIGEITSIGYQFMLLKKIVRQSPGVAVTSGHSS